MATRQSNRKAAKRTASNLKMSRRREVEGGMAVVAAGHEATSRKRDARRQQR